jgi:hypothetical protein
MTNAKYNQYDYLELEMDGVKRCFCLTEHNTFTLEWRLRIICDSRAFQYLLEDKRKPIYRLRDALGAFNKLMRSISDGDGC